MPDAPPEGTPTRHWSLTGRLAWRFALTTGLLFVVLGVGSAYSMFGAIRDDAKRFMEHEIEELAVNIELQGGGPVGVRRAIETLAEGIEHPSCAFRVRDAAGALVAEGGDPALLGKGTGPIPPGTSWREWLLTDDLVVLARALPDLPGLSGEILVDGTPYLDRLRDYGRSVSLALAIGLALAGFAGWLTAHRGLRGLREVARRARLADPVSHSASIELHDAPEEIHAVSVALDDLLRRIDTGLSRMRTFTAGLAHELRSPLQNLIGETEVALLKERSPAEYEQLLRSNLEDLSELSDAIDNLVAYCRVSEPPPRAPGRERFDLAEEARLRLGRESRTARRRGITLDLDARGDTELAADREGCLRVLRNLVGNAVEWSPDGATVRVLITGDDRVVRLEVEDEGPGVPDHLRDEVYEPFVTGRTRGGRRGGYGLGLAICRTVMQQHEGELRHEPRAGGGTRFVAEFPRGR